MAGQTKLQAVNIMLGNIGEAPVASLTNSDGDAFASMAINVLDETVLALCLEDWDFNKDIDYPLTPDINGEIAITDSILSVDSSYRSAHLDVRVEQDKLYNKCDHTFVFDGTVYCEIQWDKTYDELPQYMRYYATVRAARLFAGRQLGDVTSDQLTADDEFNAKVAAKRRDGRNTDRSLFDRGLLSNIKRRSI